MIEPMSVVRKKSRQNVAGSSKMNTLQLEKIYAPVRKPSTDKADKR